MLRPLVLALILAYVASASTWADDARNGAAEFRVLRSIPYRPDAASDYEHERCRLDLYLPTGVVNFPTLVWFHGGGLRNKDDWSTNLEQTLAERFAAQGIAVAPVTYRLSPQVKFPAYVDDAAAAIAFVHRQIAEQGGDPRSLFVSGHSAGGYLTAIVGTDPQYLDKYGLQPTDLAGCIPVSGQMVTHFTIRGERGIPETQMLVDAAAPLYHSHEKLPPFLNIVGGNDMAMRAEENRLFVAAVKANAKQEATYLEVPDRTHGTIAGEIPTPGDPAGEALLEFIQRHRKTATTTK